MVINKGITKNEKTEFTKRDTNIVKGFLIIMVMVHHLFYDTGTYENFDMTYLFLNQHQVLVFVQYFKFCIAAFAFLTYYGMTRKFMSIPDTEVAGKSTRIVLKQYIHLALSFLFVYILALIPAIATKRDLITVYSVAEKPWVGYGVIDALGMADFFHTPTMNITWWYMSFAIVIMFLFPLFYLAYQKLGLILVAAIAFIPGALLLDQTYYGMCGFSMVMGMVVAKTDLFARIRAFGKGNIWVKLLKVVGCLFLFAVTYGVLFYGVSLPWYCAIASITWVYACYEFLAPVKGLNSVLAFFGKNSLNIFLIHTLIYYYYATEWIYSFKVSFLIAFALIGTSLLGSVLIEGLKKILHYEQAIRFIQNKVIYIYEIARGSEDDISE